MITWIAANLLVYAITGGPGTGKTSIIESLKTESEIIVSEAATHLIKERQAVNIAHPWEDPDFNFHINLLQEEFEQEALEKAKKTRKNRVFVDRGVLDPLVYAEMELKNDPLSSSKLEKYHQLKNRVTSLAENHYDKIFFVLPHTTSSFQIENTAVRKESSAESLQIADHILEVYQQFLSEDKIVFVPGDLTPRQRASFILSYLNANNFGGR